MAPSRSGSPGIGGFEEMTRVPAGSLTDSRSSPDQMTLGAERASSSVTQPSWGTSARRPTAFGRGSPKIVGSGALMGSDMAGASPINDGPAPSLSNLTEPR